MRKFIAMNYLETALGIRQLSMKKFLFIFMFMSLSALIYAQSSAPFTTGRWQGRINYTDTNNIKHSDLYEIVFVPNGTCIVTVSTKEKGVDVMQDGDGLWSFDEGDFPILRIECDFLYPTIERIDGIRWTSMYQFDKTQTRFTLLVPPYQGAKNNVKIAFIQVME